MTWIAAILAAVMAFALGMWWATELQRHAMPAAVPLPPYDPDPLWVDA